MAYWSIKGKNLKSTESFGLGGGTSPSAASLPEFYELEPAVVLDIVLDSTHPIFSPPSDLPTHIDTERWPADLQGKKPTVGDFNYSWIGRVLVRLYQTTPTSPKEKLVWAYPMGSGCMEYPLVNEIVMVMEYQDQYFYSRKLNYRNFPNEAADFSINNSLSGVENTNLYTNKPYTGVHSKNSAIGQLGYNGVVGKYYKINDRMRAIKRHEGDTVIESRFGQSIHLGVYDDTRSNDIGDKQNTDYYNGGGNPMIIIRNRQRKLLKTGETLSLTNSPHLATIKGTPEEKNAGGYISEDINHDGSTIAITTGQTITNWVTTCYKHMFAEGMEEQAAFSPQGCSTFQYPILDGDQIIMNSDRIILSSRSDEMFHYAKKRYAVVTDSEYTVDAHDQIVFTTNTRTTINSPAIYLGEYDQTAEPVLLGQTSVDWLSALCDWLLAHTHKHEHSHVNAGAPSPKTTQTTVQDQKLIQLQQSLHALMSRRVFTVGGGFAPGDDGVSI